MRKNYKKALLTVLISVFVFMAAGLGSCIRKQPDADLSGLTYIDLSGKNGGGTSYDYLYCISDLWVAYNRIHFTCHIYLNYNITIFYWAWATLRNFAKR